MKNLFAARWGSRSKIAFVFVVFLSVFATAGIASAQSLVAIAQNAASAIVGAAVDQANPGTFQTTAATQPAANFARTITVTGITDEGFNFTGTLDLTDFFFDGTNLLMEGNITGDLGPIGTVSAFVSIPVLLIPDTSFCDLVTISVGPVDVTLAGLTVHLNAFNVSLDALAALPPEVDATTLGDLLCTIGIPPDLASAAATLNQILAMFP